MENNYIEKALRDELRIINKHLPYTRPTLQQLLTMDLPHIVLRDGTIHLIEEKELELLSKLVSPEEAGRLRIPIIIEVNPSFGEGAAVIRDPLAAKVVAKILGLDYRDGLLVIYMPHITELRSKLRTTTTIIFMP